MKHLLITLALLLTILLAHTQNLYTKAFGNRKNAPVIFIHGGPGSSSVAFGITTAQKLANKGFYVIIYDRRGEGLSKDVNATYNFQQTFEDLNGIYKKFGIQKATLIGFSFGGIVSTLYAEKYPAHIQSLLLVSALLSQPETYHTILNRSKKIYEAQKDTAGLNDILKIQKMDQSSFEYRTACFKHSSKNGFFTTKNQNEHAKGLYARLASDPVYNNLSAQKSNDAVMRFWKNEHYSSMSILPVLKQLKTQHMKIYALYGKDDGLFSLKQITDLQNIIGKGNLKYLDSCAHYLYTDQQDEFIASLGSWLK